MVVPAALASSWTGELAAESIAAPTLLWSEVAAALRQLEWRNEVDATMVDSALTWLSTAGITPHPSSALLVDARRIAVALGWAKTYDAEYVALAQDLDARLATLDARLLRTVGRIVPIMDLA